MADETKSSTSIRVSRLTRQRLVELRNRLLVDGVADYVTLDETISRLLDQWERKHGKVRASQAAK